MRPDGSVRPLFDDDSLKLEGLIESNVQLLLDMGYEFDIVVKALNALKQAKRYNPIGEV